MIGIPVIGFILAGGQGRRLGGVFFEDHSRIRTKPGHFARFRSFGLNILRANGTTNVSRELYLNALNPHHALSYRST